MKNNKKVSKELIEQFVKEGDDSLVKNLGKNIDSLPGKTKSFTQKLKSYRGAKPGVFGTKGARFLFGAGTGIIVGLAAHGLGIAAMANTIEKEVEEKSQKEHNDSKIFL